ncbi:MAG: hypothetical protein IPH54_23165 [Rhodoferax sp.]|nr:hypothetical protein [Rhodoferax sp.]
MTFRGLTASATVANTSYKSNDLQVNQAIKSAINNDSVLSKLIVAQDGPANTLVITALTDGARVAADLGVALTSPTAASLTSTIVTAFNTANGTAHADGTALKAAMDVTIAGFAAGQDYTAALANDLVGNLTGVNSSSTSDNTVYPWIG